MPTSQITMHVVRLRSAGAASIQHICRPSFCTSANPRNAPPEHAERKMGAWQVHAYSADAVADLQYSDRVKMPIIGRPNDVLVRVAAASLNAIDLEMAKGFGASTFNAMRRCGDQHIEFPLTLGRDFVGVVVNKGMSVRESLRVGDRVWGTVPFHRDGSHAEYITTDACLCTPAPQNVADEPAVAALYAGLTAWSGLFLSGQLGGLTGAGSSLGGGRGRRVCILGASGGVGHLAAQMCRAEGADVVASCAADAHDLVRAAGVEHIVDYRASDAEQQLTDGGPYDIVLDCAGYGADYARKVRWSYGHYVTFTSPLLANNDAYGLLGGSVRNVMQLLADNWNTKVAANGGGGSMANGLVKWAYVVTLPQAVEYLKRLLEEGKLKPVVEQVYDFRQADCAYARMADGHLRGKIVLKM